MASIDTQTTVTLPENTPLALRLKSSPWSNWQITGGADAAQFRILCDNILSLGAKDYERPSDANGDNAYVVQVTATDLSLSQTITVTISNIVDEYTDFTVTFPSSATGSALMDASGAYLVDSNGAYLIGAA